MNIAFTFIASNRNDNVMDQQFCCYSAATKAHKLKDQGNNSLAVSLHSFADTEV